jgi:SRSO17 transposase
MNDDEIRTAAKDLEELLGPFAPLFGRGEAQRHARTYLRGLMTSLERKSIEPIALALGGGRISGLQKFINAAPWKSVEVQGEIQRAFGDRAREVGGPVVGVIKPYGFTKRGSQSVGVGRQWNPRSNRTENCQVGVFLFGVAAGDCALLDQRLYLPEAWCGSSDEARRRRAKIRLPRGMHHRTGSQIASDLIGRGAALGLVGFDWVVADEGIGPGGDLLDELDSPGLRYAVGVRGDETVLAGWETGSDDMVPGERNAPCKVTEICESLPADSWRKTATVGTRPTPREEFAVVPVRLPRPGEHPKPTWLVVRRRPPLEEESLGYYLSNAGPETTAAAWSAALSAGAVADAFLDNAERHLGLGHYETRSWLGWHHHMSMVSVAHWLVSTRAAARGSGG